MANTYNYGFRWHSSMTGGDQPKPIRCRVASAYQASPGGTSVHLRPGDWVKPVSDGTVALAVAGDTTLLGVISHIAPFYDSALGDMNISDWLPGGTTATLGGERESIVFVIPAVGQVFQGMCDDATTATTRVLYINLLGENADIVNVPVASPAAAHPLIDISTHATTTAQLRLLDLLVRPDVDYSTTYVPLLVTVNESYLPPFTTTGV